MSMNHGALIFKNGALNTLVELLNTPLAGKVARQRNRFVLLLQDAAKAMEADRMALLKQYSENGELKIDEKTNQYILTDKPAFDKEFQDLLSKTFSVECKAEQLVDFQAIHNLLDTLQTPLDIETTKTYESIMQSFEAWAKSQEK